MQLLLTYFGAALLALLAIALPALAHSQHRALIREDWRHPLRLLFGVLQSELGTVVVTYCTPIMGTPGTTAPTSNQASQVVEQQAQIFWADTDTQAIFVHNWGLPNSFPTFLWPQVIINKSLGGASDSSFATNFTVGLTNTNQVYITKVGVGTGQGGTYNVYLRRPFSMSQ